MLNETNISGITFNVNAGNRHNSMQFVAGEVADIVTSRYSGHPSMTPEKVSDMWDKVYAISTRAVRAIRKV